MYIQYRCCVCIEVLRAGLLDFDLEEYTQMRECSNVIDHNGFCDQISFAATDNDIDNTGAKKFLAYVIGHQCAAP